MRLFPDGSVRADTAAGDNTILLGRADGGPTILSWQLPPDARIDQELIVTCQVVSHGAMAAFEGRMHGGTGWREWHMGFMLRSVIADLSRGAYKGLGPILGRVWRPENNPAGVPPYVTAPGRACWRIEEWGNGVVPDFPQFEYLRTDSHSPPVVDGQRMRLFMSCKRYCGEIYSRYAVGMQNEFYQFPTVFDTGDVQSNNWAVNRDNEALTIFDIGGADRAGDYTVEIINLSAFQREATCRIPDLRFINQEKP